MSEKSCPSLSISQAAQIFKLLGEESRLRLVATLLASDEVQVGTLAEILGLSQALTSHHLGLLRMAGLVTVRRDGRKNYYSVANDFVRELLWNLKE